MIIPYRDDKQNQNPVIGCIVLTNPIFFLQEDWIPVDEYMTRAGPVQGKGFKEGDLKGPELWDKISTIIEKYLKYDLAIPLESELTGAAWLGYGKSILQKVRLGQGAFRVLVTDAYTRKCSISGEKTLPVLEAAHIKPYNLEGPHSVSNGLLLRSDIHKLFDGGYMTITKEFKVEVSKAIKEEFENGKEYYQYHGKELLYLPTKEQHRPGEKFIEWHNNIFKG